MLVAFERDTWEIAMLDLVFEGDVMSSRKIGRRKFIQGASSAVLGLAAAPFLNTNPTFADTEKTVTPGPGLLEKPD